MTAQAQIFAGGRFTASEARGVAPLAAYKTVDQSMTGDTSYVNDSALYLPVVANAVYLLQAMIIYEGGTANASDYDWELTGTGLTLALSAVQWTRAATPATALLYSTGGGGNGTNGSGTQLTMSLSGLVTTTSATTLQYAFKCHSSPSTTTITHLGSWLALWQVA